MVVNKFKNSVFFEENGAGDFGSVYMILVFAIAALLLVVVVKPIFSSSQKSIAKTNSGN
jgi:competence protein ComGC